MLAKLNLDRNDGLPAYLELPQILQVAPFQTLANLSCGSTLRVASNSCGPLDM